MITVEFKQDGLIYLSNIRNHIVMSEFTKESKSGIIWDVKYSINGKFDINDDLPLEEKGVLLLVVLRHMKKFLSENQEFVEEIIVSGYSQKHSLSLRRLFDYVGTVLKAEVNHSDNYSRMNLPLTEQTGPIVRSIKQFNLNLIRDAARTVKRGML